MPLNIRNNDIAILSTTITCELELKQSFYINFSSLVMKFGRYHRGREILALVHGNGQMHENGLDFQQ